MKLHFIPFAVLVLVLPFLLQTTKADTAVQNLWQGPLAVENERPFQALFLHFAQENPDVLPRGAKRFGMQLDIANNLLIPTPGSNGEIVTEDFETQRLKISWRRGLGHKIELGLGTNLTARNGGFLDAPIEWYHNLLGLAGTGVDNPVGRDNIPRGRSSFMFQNALGQGVNEGSAFGLGDSRIWMKKQLSQGRFSSAARVALKLPTGSESRLLGSGSFDSGVALDMRYQFAHRWALFGNVGAAKYGSSSIPGAAKSGVQGGLGFEWRIGRRESIVAQMDAARRAVTTGNPIADRTPIIGSIGFKKQISESRAYWVSISENGDFHNYNAPFFGNIAPDFTLSLGYEWCR